MDVFDYMAFCTVNTEDVFVARGSDTEIGGLFIRLKKCNGVRTPFRMGSGVS